jgi:hypothetical protein
MNMETIQSVVSETLVNLVLAVITLAGTYAIYYIRLGASKLQAQTAQIADEKARQLLNNAVLDVTGLVTLSVGAMEQTTAKALREAVKAGTKDRAELVALGREVFNDVKKQIGPETQRVITENLGSFDSYLKKCIENEVLKVKQADPILLPESIVFDDSAQPQ